MIIDEKVVFEDDKLIIKHVTYEREGTSLASNDLSELLAIIAFIYRHLQFPLVKMEIEKAKNIRYTYQKMIDKKQEGIKIEEGLHTELQQETESPEANGNQD